jgi:alpha-ketoglutarate-dependent taurine dioxygenase
MTFSTVDLTPRIGTAINTDVATLLSGARSREIRTLLEQRGVLLFRGIELDDEQEIAFAATLGSLREEFGHRSMAITPDKRFNPIFADYFEANIFWHLDGAWEDVPPLASILTPRVLAPVGGETEFADAYGAYEDLPETDQKLLQGLKAVHTMEAAVGPAFPNPTEEQIKSWRNYPTKIHPLVWQHRSGRKSLALSSTISHVLDMDRQQSDALLGRLMAFVTKREFVYQHQWRIKDVLMWNNTGTLHRVLPFDKQSGRRLQRVTLLGEEPLASVA